MTPCRGPRISPPPRREGCGAPAREWPPPGRPAQAAFSLLQAILLLALVGLTAAVVLPLGSRLLSLQRSSRTERQLERIKRAVVGHPELGDGRERASYGFAGDIGAVPDSLPQLVGRRSLPPYTVSPDRRMGAGWRGPYYRPGTLSDTLDVRRDAFGRPLRYVTVDSAVDGRTWDAYLQSGGEDGDLATAADNVTVPILRSETTVDTVRGVAVDPDGDPAASTEVALTFRRNGALVDTTAITDASGGFRFLAVPAGRARVRLGAGASGGGGGGEIAYVPGSAVYQGGAEREIEFTVRNTGSTDIEVTSWTATYDRTAYYRIVKIATPDDAGEGKTVFDAGPGGGGASWPGSGDPVTFDVPDTIPPPAAATAAASDHARTLALDGPRVLVDTLRLLPAPGGAGGPTGTVIRIEEFRANANGTGGVVDMSGASFTIDFSDGSTVSFTVP